MRPHRLTEPKYSLMIFGILQHNWISHSEPRPEEIRNHMFKILETANTTAHAKTPYPRLTKEHLDNLASTITKMKHFRNVLTYFANGGCGSDKQRMGYPLLRRTKHGKEAHYTVAISGFYWYLFTKYHRRTDLKISRAMLEVLANFLKDIISSPQFVGRSIHEIMEEFVLGCGRYTDQVLGFTGGGYPMGQLLKVAKDADLRRFLMNYCFPIYIKRAAPLYADRAYLTLREYTKH